MRIIPAVQVNGSLMLTILNDAEEPSLRAQKVKMKLPISWLKRLFLVAILGTISPPLSAVDYTQELRDQIEQTERQFLNQLTLDYFHDMGIIARKADEAELVELATEITGTLLLKRMDEYVQTEVKAINRLYETDRFAATKRLEALNRLERYYQPTEEFLNTISGQALSGELARFRQGAIAELENSCSDFSLLQGIQAIRKTGLFMTGHAQEVRDIQVLTPKVECCLGWKPKIRYSAQQEFKTDYEEGTLIQKADLNLETNRRDLSEARWRGDWIYRFKGRGGVGEGISQAILTYTRGSDTAGLVISASRLSSVGRINFPVSLAGDRRTIEIDGEPIYPKAILSGQAVSLNGCLETKP